MKAALLNRGSDWSDIRVCVVGAGVAGVGAAISLAKIGAQVSVIDEAAMLTDKAGLAKLAAQGVDIQLGRSHWSGERPDLLVVSPGVKPFAEVITQANSEGVEIWGELELAWRLRPMENPAPWLAVSGTNGKTTTTLMAKSMANYETKTAAAIGNIGVSAVEAMLGANQPDIYVVETAAAQLVFANSIRPLASVVLNFAPDHLDYFGNLDRYEAAKAKVYRGTEVAAIYNASDPVTKRMLESAELATHVRRIGISLKEPKNDEFGVADGWLVDNAFSERGRLAPVDAVKPAAMHNVTNALAAAALVRAAGYPTEAVFTGLKNFRPAKHRIANVAEIDGVTYIDDSKATNAHAAGTSIKSYHKVVWVGGGLAKGQDFSGLVQEIRTHLRGVVLLGRDREEIRSALARHAPDVPVASVADTEPDCMREVVSLASQMAKPGDVVLLAPACASWDMFRDYQHRGDEFANAVTHLKPAARAS